MGKEAETANQDRGEDEAAGFEAMSGCHGILREGDIWHPLLYKVSDAIQSVKAGFVSEIIELLAKKWSREFRQDDKWSTLGLRRR